MPKREAASVLFALHLLLHEHEHGFVNFANTEPDRQPDENNRSIGKEWIGLHLNFPCAAWKHQNHSRYHRFARPSKPVSGQVDLGHLSRSQNETYYKSRLDFQ